MRKFIIIRTSGDDYDRYINIITEMTDWLEVSEEEYQLISRWAIKKGYKIIDYIEPNIPQVLEDIRKKIQKERDAQDKLLKEKKKKEKQKSIQKAKAKV